MPKSGSLPRGGGREGKPLQCPSAEDSRAGNEGQSEWGLGRRGAATAGGTTAKASSEPQQPRAAARATRPKRPQEEGLLSGRVRGVGVRCCAVGFWRGPRYTGMLGAKTMETAVGTGGSEVRPRGEDPRNTLRGIRRQSRPGRELPRQLQWGIFSDDAQGKTGTF